ncbi:hypothetical protein [Undibacterium crateris]|uniref:hypothetical protein n=1 Tax=Undibacterium crateris TaxID=2528175 RepID=UPI00138975D8|nr:hypothetical protein [Undibacterium crateris]NDI85703.1 hypothetical protein [Undibacterium crateris]
MSGLTSALSVAVHLLSAVNPNEVTDQHKLAVSKLHAIVFCVGKGVKHSAAIVPDSGGGHAHVNTSGILHLIFLHDTNM